MTDQTDRQRAEGNVVDVPPSDNGNRDFVNTLIGNQILAAERDQYANKMIQQEARIVQLEAALLSARREGWEAGREDAAKAADDVAKRQREIGADWLARDPQSSHGIFGLRAAGAETAAAAIRALKPKES